jgi:hypothetical protein
MGKAHRGKPLRQSNGKNRGTCPVCNRTGVKRVFEVTQGEATVKVCKCCRNAKA